MNDNNMYKVYYKTTDKAGAIETLAEFECDRERYMYEIDKAIKNALTFTASDTVYGNDNGGRKYFVSINIW